MNAYTVEINTIAGIADSDVLDRLAALVYELDQLVDPTLALNDDGSVTATFEVAGVDPLAASQMAVQAFLEAVAAAKPLCLPSADKVVHAAAQALDGFAVSHIADREHVLA